MSRRTLLTISTAAALLGVYWFYALTVTPLFRAPALSRPLRQVETQTSAPDAPPINVQMARSHLASQTWAAEAKYQFRTDKTFLYAEHFEQVASNAIRFKPFAMIWFQKSEQPGQEPITVMAESALLRFSGSLDPRSLNPGEITIGVFERDVFVNGPNGLTISGRNFFFEKAAMHIRSDNPVDFTYETHSGKAAGGVQVELLANGDGGDNLSIEGVHSVRLHREVSMNVVFEEDGDPVRAHIECDGGFRYILETNQATFENNVRATKPTGPNQADLMRGCDLLTLQFEADAEEGGTGPAEAAAEESSRGGLLSSDSKLAFRGLHAEGRAMKLISQGNHFVAAMTDLVYDYQTKIAALTDGKSVRVWHGRSELKSPEITVLHDDDGKINAAWCRGAGSMVHRDEESGETLLAARWNRQLRKYPDPGSKLAIVELQDDAKVWQPGRNTQLAAELIKLWIDEDAPAEAGSPSSSLDEGAPKIRPRRLLALGDLQQTPGQNEPQRRRLVQWVSPQLQGETRRLEVWFDERAPMPPENVSQRESRDRLQPAIRRVSAVRNVATDSGRGTNRLSASGGKALSDEPVTLMAGLVRVRVVYGEDRDATDVAEVWTENDVNVFQKRPGGEQPFHLTGDRLHLLNRTESEQELRIYGTPAIVRDRGTYLEGNDILVDRLNNSTKIEGAGLLTLPVRNDFEGNELQRPQNLDIAWNEQMRFDGEEAVFFGNVSARLADSSMWMHCEEMHVALSQRVSFGDKQPKADENTIREIVCKDGVEFASYEYEGTKLVGIRKARVWEFSVNPISGETEAAGLPGLISFWKRTEGKRSTLAPAAVAQANRPLETESAEWEFSQIRFSGKMTGNLKGRHTRFEDRVLVVHGPVDQPLDTIDPDALPDNAGWMRCQTLELSQQPKSDSEPESITMLASGNAELTGNTFRGLADTISYDHAKELFILKSWGSRKATLWRQKTIGDEPSRAMAQRMEFIPSRNQLLLDRTTGIQGVP